MDRREERREPCEAVVREGRDEVVEVAGEADIRMPESSVWGREGEDTVARIGPVLGCVTSGTKDKRLYVSTLSLSGSYEVSLRSCQ